MLFQKSISLNLVHLARVSFTCQPWNLLRMACFVLPGPAPCNLWHTRIYSLYLDHEDPSSFALSTPNTDTIMACLMHLVYSDPLSFVLSAPRPYFYYNGLFSHVFPSPCVGSS